MDKKLICLKFCIAALASSLVLMACGCCETVKSNEVVRPQKITSVFSPSSISEQGFMQISPIQFPTGYDIWCRQINTVCRPYRDKSGRIWTNTGVYDFRNNLVWKIPGILTRVSYQFNAKHSQLWVFDVDSLEVCIAEMIDNRLNVRRIGLSGFKSSIRYDDLYSWDDRSFVFVGSAEDICYFSINGGVYQLDTIERELRYRFDVPPNFDPEDESSFCTLEPGLDNVLVLHSSRYGLALVKISEKERKVLKFNYDSAVCADVVGERIFLHMYNRSEADEALQMSIQILDAETFELQHVIPLKPSIWVSLDSYGISSNEDSDLLLAIPSSGIFNIYRKSTNWKVEKVPPSDLNHALDSFQPYLHGSWRTPLMQYSSLFKLLSNYDLLLPSKFCNYSSKVYRKHAYPTHSLEMTGGRYLLSCSSSVNLSIFDLDSESEIFNLASKQGRVILDIFSTAVESEFGVFFDVNGRISAKLFSIEKGRVKLVSSEYKGKELETYVAELSRDTQWRRLSCVSRRRITRSNEVWRNLRNPLMLSYGQLTMCKYSEHLEVFKDMTLIGSYCRKNEDGFTALLNKKTLLMDYDEERHYFYNMEKETSLPLSFPLADPEFDISTQYTDFFALKTDKRKKTQLYVFDYQKQEFRMCEYSCATFYAYLDYRTVVLRSKETDALYLARLVRTNISSELKEIETFIRLQ